ncbi:pilus assembly protein TadG-related protein [Propylenella binzhouense]|uniref:pilus assembly protein TadG-related protein n=1 Tax=Propylenella binzhouense TaxID=2555902 RepID=UPI0031B56DB8
MTPAIALMFVVLAALIGLAIDTGRAHLVKSKLHYSLDAAGLAVGAKLDSTDLDAEVTEFVATNFPTGYVGATVTDVTPVLSADKSVLTITATATVPTTFMKLVGIEEVSVAAESEITRTTTGLELVMVLDNTGSMSSQMSNLKGAAKELVNILYGGANTVDDLYVGLVPFSQAVNVGSARTGWIDAAHKDSLNWGPSGSSWAGCVEARGGGRDVTDDPPSAELFRVYYSPDSSNNDWIRSDGTYRTPLGTGTRGPNVYCPATVTPMTRQKSTIVGAIDAMQAVGGTHVNVGAVWGWRMLSPRWRGLWGGDMGTYNLPLDYNTELMEKAAVIMTDGANTVYDNIYSAYGFLSEGRLGTTSISAGEDELDTRLLSVCTAMKNAGILVYTIAFNNPGATIQTMMQKCATQPDFYFNSPTASDLSTAFRTIGDALSNLRVSR